MWPESLGSKKCGAAVSMFLVLAALLLFAGHAMAQVSGATLTGTVKDSSGATIPEASVLITNVATGVARSIVTDTAGLYSAPNLAPGSYEVKVSAPGFATLDRQGITLTVGAQQGLDFTMRVGQTSQSVEVVGQAPVVDVVSSTIQAEVNSTTVRELPLNGRSWTDLGSLQPGVNQPNTQMPFTASGRGQRGFGNQVAISGNRPDQNSYRLDGLNVNDYSNGAPSNVIGGALGVDAIQEFSVMTGNFPAQYGRAAGGVFNAITRSGTNAVHGSAYEFLRNSALDARNPFDAPQIPPFRRNQFGGSIGGPLQKDHTFFFADYEGLRQSLGVTQVGQTLSPNARNGLLNFATPAQFPAGCTDNGVTGNVNGKPYSQCSIPVDPAIARFIGADFLPVMNGALSGLGVTGLFTNAVQQVGIENFVTGKLDHTFSNSDTLSGTYLFDNNALDLPDLQDVKILETHLRRQFIDLQETHVFNSRIINSFRVGLNRNYANIQSTPTAVNPSAADPSFGAVPGLFAPTVSIPGVDKFTGGLDGPPHYMFAFNSYQAADDIFLTKGVHSIKLGVSLERLQDNDEDIPSADGVFTFKSVATFLTNHPSRFQGLIPGTVSERGLRESLVGMYAQDDWRIKPNLTLNLGLRYEFATVPSEVQNKVSNFYNITDPAPHIGSPLFSNFTHRNFEPRIGFSWDPFADGKTALRGGFGIYDIEPLPYEFFLGTAQAAPFLERATTTNTAGLAGNFPAGALPLLVGNPATFTYEWIQGNARRRYVMQWNVSAERQLSANNSIMAAYVGSSGVHLPLHMDDSNMVIPTLTSAGYVWPKPIGSGTKINPNFGPMVSELMMSHSSYHGAMLQLKHTGKRYLFQGSYSWSRSIDNSSGTFAGDAYSNGIPTLDWYAPRLDRGPSDFNITQNLIISGTFNLPGINSNSWATWLTNGWEIGTIFKANTGVPFSATMGAGADILGQNNTDPWDWPNRMVGGDCSSLVNPGNTASYIKTQCFTVPTAPNLAFYQTYCDPTVGTYPQCFNLRGNAGRNILIGPNLVNLDFSVFKNNYIKRISEGFNAQFRVEMFNLLNRPNFSFPSSNAVLDASGTPIAGAGLITTTVTPSRQIQFALKLIW